MKKYVVICYAVHKKEIASHDAFDNKLSPLSRTF